MPLTIKDIEDAAKLIDPRGSLYASPGVYDWLRKTPEIKQEDYPLRYGGFLGTYLGIRMYQAPKSLFRAPDKPLRSRPRRRYVRAYRKAVKPERPRLRPLLKAHHCQVFKTRKVPDRRGYSQNTIFMFNPYA
jgi:hypothetical protein